MEALIVFGSVVAIVGIVKYFNYKKQLLERITMNPEDIKVLGQLNMGNETLRFGLLFIGMALGLILGNLLLKFDIISEPIFSYLTGLFLCGGICLIIGYFIENKNTENNKKD